MLAKRYRLSHRDDLIRCRRQGRRFHSSMMTVYVCQNTIGHLRLGVTVGMRVSRKAVVRNKIRRMIFAAAESFRTYSLDIYVLPTQSAKNLTQVRVSKEFSQWLK